ncbi:MAG: efflux RND transporter periplasmic adaptor subunit [Candidatus Poribacteria bacterium]|nr:efflux RND transporter periplasmic adaptor subunit [Candidatus Poribacteria bacterium]
MIKNINRNTIIFPLLLLTIGFVAGCGRTDSAEEHTAEKTMDGMAQHAEHAEHTEHSEHAEHGVVAVTSADGEKIRYWTCVMHPSVKMPVEADCPVCKMDLIPVYEGVGLTLTERQKSLIPVRTESVEFRNLNREIRTVGVLDYNETRMAYASTRISGWIEDLHVDFTGINVREGDELLTIYSPELLAAQEEYLTALKSVDELKDTQYAELKRTVEQTLSAAKSKLELFGLTLEQIDDIREHGKARTTLPLYAPSGGTVIHMNVYKGQHVKSGTNLYRIADLKSLWIIADIYEYELPWVYMGQDVEITAQSMPDQTFHGKVNYIYPYFDAPTRTQKVHIEVPNPDGQLRPGMYVTLRLKPTLAEIYALEAQPKAAYACPMHPWITSEMPSDCDICGMDLESTRPEAAVSGPMESVWTCPMHPQIKQSEFGECDICGMDLIEKQVPVEAHAHAGHSHTEMKSQQASTTQEKWVCPMHPEVQADEMIECDICGMDLIETQVPVEAHAHAGHSHSEMESPHESAAQEKWVCPMHPEVQADEMIECDICGMDLVKSTVPAKSTAHVGMASVQQEPPLVFKYACPDHPDQYATLPDRCSIDGKPLVMTGEVLSVPKSAVIDTGLRKIVFIDRDESGYELLEVELGPEAWAEVEHNGRAAKRRFYPVIKGLNPGDIVVTNGNYLLDSQTQLTGSAAGAYGGALGGDEGSSAPPHRH